MRDRRAATTRSRARLLLGLLLAGAVATANAADIKIATVAPDGSRWMQQMRAGAEEVKTRTAGRVTLKFYPGGVMGNDAQVLRKIRIGQLQGGAFTAGGLAERYPALNLYGIPLLFSSLDEVDAVRSALDPELAAGLEQAGFVTFGFIEGGFANLLSNEPIRSVEDMRRKKVWVPEGDNISFLAMETMGLSPSVLPVTDVLTGLQTGLIDITFASPVAALVLQWHTKVKYITDIPVSYSMGVFAIEKGVYAGLSAEDQRVVREVMGRYILGLDHEARDDNRKATEVLARSGLETVTVNHSDLEGWRKSIESIHPQLRARPDIDAALFDRLLAVLAEYRRAHL
ncbi:MAG TPA: TRAP transporter substrate-binding protein DctP [Gammaproteobacteria bacterium]|nr:TRAP transporter substrate-binding protein DctP [Gammaproteobacteria bacterium]